MVDRLSPGLAPVQPPSAGVLGRVGGPLALATVIAVISCATVAGAWAFQWAGYPPCELCLKGRVPHYAGIILAVLTIRLAARKRVSLLPAAFVGLMLLFGLGGVFSLYHAGVEWHFWPGPSSCTGSYAAPADVGSLLGQLNSVNVVRCDAAALHVFGLSLAVWNAVICFALAGLSLAGLAASVRTRRGTIG